MDLFSCTPAMISLDSQMNGQNNNKLNKRRRRSKRHVGGNVGQMIKKEEFEQAMHRSFVHVVESFYLDNVIVAPSGYNQELLVVSWLRQFRRVTVDDFILAVVIQNFLGTGIGSFPECASDKKSLTVRVLDAALDFDIETIFADMKQARKFEMAVSHCDMHAQACKEMSPSNVCYSPGSAVSPDPFVCDGQWIECSPPSTMDALTLVNCNQPYSPRSASPVVFTPRSPSPSDEVLPFPADIDVPLPAPTGYGAAASEFPQLNMYVWPSPSPFLMHQAAVDGSRNDRDRDVAMTGYFHHVNNMVAMPRVPGVPVPQMRQAPVYEYEYATPVTIAYPQRQLDAVLPQPPRPMTPPVLVKPMIPRLNFHAMSVSDIIRQRLTLSEIVRYDLLERLMTDPNGSKYLQWLLKQQFVDNKTECIQFIADHIVCLSRRKFICRVVQEILKAIDDQQIVMKIAAAFQKQCEQQKGSPQDTLSQCVQCCNANRVLQFLIQSGLPFAAMKFLGDELNRNLVQYSEDRNACHVLQSFVKMYGDKIDIAQLLSNKAHLYLARTVHGNYVIQCLIKRNEWYSKLDAFVVFREKLIYDIFGESNLEYFSKHKQGSNVIEECIRSSTAKQISYLTNILCKAQGSLLRKLMRDKFGNYVPKTLLRFASRKQQFFIVNTVDAYIVNLNFGRQYLSNFKHCAEFIDACASIKNHGQLQ